MRSLQPVSVMQDVVFFCNSLIIVQIDVWTTAILSLITMLIISVGIVSYTVKVDNFQIINLKPV